MISTAVRHQYTPFIRKYSDMAYSNLFPAKSAVQGTFDSSIHSKINTLISQGAISDAANHN
jgi:hypothetical protein